MAQQATRQFIDDHCPNCLKPLPDDLDAIFDSEVCKQAARTVRYARRVFSDGRIDREDVRAAIRRRLWFAASGGYPTKARRVPTAVRAAVKERDHERCQSCGQPGNQIDHIHGDSGDLTNLQVLCVDCHNIKTDVALFGSVTDATELGSDPPAGGEPDVNPAVAALLDRALAPVPVRLCDDETAWDAMWLELLLARRQRIVEHLEASGVDMYAIRRLPRADRADAIVDALVGDQFERVTEDDDGGYGPDSYFARSMQRDD